MHMHVPQSAKGRLNSKQKRLTFKMRGRFRGSSSTLALVPSVSPSLRPSISGILRGKLTGGGNGTCCVRLRSLLLVVREIHVPPATPPSTLDCDGFVPIVAKGALNPAGSRWYEGISDAGMGLTSVGRPDGGRRSSCSCQRSDRDCCSCGWYCSCCCCCCCCRDCRGGC